MGEICIPKKDEGEVVCAHVAASGERGHWAQITLHGKKTLVRLCAKCANGEEVPTVVTLAP